MRKEFSGGWVTVTDDHTQIICGGSITYNDHHACRELREYIQSSICDGMVINVSPMEFMSSPFISVLAFVAKYCVNTGITGIKLQAKAGHEQQETLASNLKLVMPNIQIIGMSVPNHDNYQFPI